MIIFLLGTMFGSMIGIFAMCLCTAAGQADREMNCTESENEIR